MKTCTRCGESKPLDAFPLRRDGECGSWCRLCKSEHSRLRYAQDSSTKRAYRAANAEVKRQRAKAYYQANRDRKLEDARRQVVANPIAAQARRRRGRAVRRSRELEPATIVPRDLRSLGTACLACGSIDRLTLEHLIPISRGGRHAIGNLATLCRTCNCSKGDLTWTEWRASGRPGVPAAIRLQVPKAA